MAAGAAGIYYINLKGTTQYYNKDKSYNVQRFKLTIECFTTQVRTQHPVLAYEFQLGLGLLDEILFEPFEMWPICTTAT